MMSRIRIDLVHFVNPVFFLQDSCIGESAYFFPASLASPSFLFCHKFSILLSKTYDTVSSPSYPTSDQP